MSVISFLKHLIQKLFFMYTWNIVVLLIVMLLISVLYLILKRKIVNKKTTNTVFLVSFAIYFALMIYSTLIDRSSETESAGLCLIPFYSYYQLFKGNTDIFNQSIMNIAFFYPFGFLIGGLDVNFLKKRKWIIAIFAFAFSFCIESLQFIFHLGYAEIDDVIHNTLGAIIGIIAVPFLNKLFDDIELKVKSML